MPVYIYQPDALDRMASVEGPQWRALQETDRGGCCSFAAFLEHWNTIWVQYQGEYPHWILYDTKLTVRGNGAIYGDDGYARYIVRGDGEIQYLRGMEREPEDLDRAREAGFRIMGECASPTRENI